MAVDCPRRLCQHCGRFCLWFSPMTSNRQSMRSAQTSWASRSPDAGYLWAKGGGCKIRAATDLKLINSAHADTYDIVAKSSVAIGHVSGLRQLAVIALLRPFLDSPGRWFHLTETTADP